MALAVDVLAQSHELMYTHNSSFHMDSITEEIYASRRRLINTLLKCQLDFALPNPQDKKKLSKSITSTSSSLPLKCQEFSRNASTTKAGDHTNYQHTFQRSNNMSKKSDANNCLRDSGFFDRVSLFSQSSESDQSTCGHLSSNGASRLTDNSQKSVQPSLNMDSCSCKSHRRSCRNSSTCQSLASNQSDCPSDWDSESVCSNYTLNDSQDDSDSGLVVYEGHRSKRRHRPHYLSHQDSMFNATKTSLLYFPKPEQRQACSNKLPKS